MADADSALHRLDRSLVWAGFRQLAPISVFVIVFGAAFGLAATLYPWLRQLPAGKRYGVMLVASDANWAMSMQAFSRGQPGLGLLLGGGIALWSFWVLGTWLGVYFGSALSDPKRLGLDMVMGCFLLAMVAGEKKNPRMLVISTTAAISSLLAYRYLPENSHVIAGALAGGLAGAFWKEAKHEH